MMIGTQISQGASNGMNDQMAASMEADYQAGKTATEPIQYNALYNGMMDHIGQGALHNATDWMKSYGSFDDGPAGDSGDGSGLLSDVIGGLANFTPFGGAIQFAKAAQNGDIGGALEGIASSAAFFTGDGEIGSLAESGGMSSFDNSMTTLYRNVGPNELKSILDNNNQFLILPDGFQGKQFWIGQSGLDFWNSSTFAKPYNVKMDIPTSYITPTSPDYLFFEPGDPYFNGMPTIDNHPAGTVLPQNIGLFNSVISNVQQMQ